MRTILMGLGTELSFRRGAKQPAEIIAAAKLPQALAAAVTTVVGHTGLRRSERCEVAAELCNHFADGLEAGLSEQELLSSFGEPRAAAKLITRAVKRKRGWVYQTRRRIGQALGLSAAAVLIVYTVLFIRFHSGTVNVARNYTAEFNARVTARPAAEMAMPVYYSVLPDWHRIMPPADGSLDTFPKIEPDSPGWPLMVDHVQRNAEGLATIRRAAGLPGLGLMLRSTQNPVLREFSRRGVATEATPAANEPVTPAEANPPLFTINLEELSVFRQFARTLAADARCAAVAGDAKRAAADVTALVGLARQIREPGLIISDLVANSISELAFSVVSDVLESHSRLLSDAQLIELMHVLAAAQGSGNPFRVRFDAERLFFEDTLQRVFSDDGKGDGVVVAGGIGMISALQVGGALVRDETSLSQRLLEPAAAGLMASRRDTATRYNDMIDRAERISLKPLWEHDDASFSFLDDTSGLDRNRYLVVYTLIPALQHVMYRGEMTLQLRDGALVALALELHHRRTGAYPKALSELVPGLLPTIPPDRYTGRPIGYTLSDGRPVVYSVGVDRIDNGGTAIPGDGKYSIVRTWMPAAAAEKRLKELQSRPPRTGGEPDIRGDWILFPGWKPQRPEKAEPAAAPTPAVPAG